jgi:hypothetical protein
MADLNPLCTLVQHLGVLAEQVSQRPVQRGQFRSSPDLVSVHPRAILSLWRAGAG